MVSLISALRAARQSDKSAVPSTANTRRGRNPIALVALVGLLGVAALATWFVGNAGRSDVPGVGVATIGASLLLLAVSIVALRDLVQVPAAAPNDTPSRSHASAATTARVRDLLILAIVVTVAYVIWRDSGPWKYWIAVTIAIAVAVGRLGAPWPDIVVRGRTSLAGTLRAKAARIELVRPLRRLRRWTQPGAWAAIPLLALLNIVVALFLLSTPEVFSRIWAVPTLVMFALMLSVNVALLNSVLVPWRRDTTTGEARSVVEAVPVEPVPVEAVPVEAVPEPTATAGGLPPHAEPPRAPRGDRLPRLVAIVATIAATAWIAVVHPGAPLAFAVLVVGAALVFTLDVDRHDAVTMVLAVAAGVATVDYVSWRIAVTNWAGWWIAAPLLCAEVLGAVHVLGYQFTIWPRRARELHPTEDPCGHPVFVFIPTVDEGVAILRHTLEGCLAARVRLLAQAPDASVTIVVCNDGRVAGAAGWEAVEALACDLGVRCVTRTTPGGAKAGNIEHARQELGATGDALVAIFDADQVPEPDFFVRTIAPFADANVGWVQTGQYYANLDNPVARWADDQQSLFYNVLCPGKAALDAAFICGTNVVIRAAALDEIGGLPQDSVTEDFAASIVLHRKWRSVYLPEVLATGLGPLDIPSYLRQQGRWGRGTLGVLGSNWRDIFLPKKNGLHAGQRVQYGLACTHYLCGLRDFLFMISPILFVFTLIPAVRKASIGDYLWHFLPYAVLGLTAMWYSARRVSGLRGVVIGFGSFPVLIQSLAAVILRRKTGFAVTSKAAARQRSFGYLGVYIFMALLCVAALVWAAHAQGAERTSLFISVLWIIYSLSLLGGFLGLALADLRAHATRDVAEPAVAVATKQRYPAKLSERPSALRPIGTLGVAALLATPLLVTPPLNSASFFAPHARKFVLADHVASRPYVGASFPVQLLQSRPTTLAHDLGTQFDLVGRTQAIDDRFDAHWANDLAHEGGAPWITLEFGQVRNGHAPLSANLPSIYNGVHDAQLERWARAIRNFGKPVYLTILPHADKNWSASSGVANGGIPTDVPVAWRHVQTVFRAAGANNVAWVWAPADPANDRRFAPPASSIDAVLQSFVNYPGTRWGDPAAVLARLRRRYPRTPLIIEASAAGLARPKAEWMTRLRRAVEATPGVYAVLYHEGGPSLSPSRDEEKFWSLESDHQSFIAIKRMFDAFDRERSVR